MELRSSEQIQGNILAPFNKPYQQFLFVSFGNNRPGARRWLATLTGEGRIATTRAVADHNAAFKAQKAKDGDPQPRQIWMGIGLTSWGLVTLHPELAADLVAYEAFWRGPLAAGTDERGNWTASAALVGGEEHSDPRAWVIGGPNQAPIDALVTIAADDRGDLRERVDAERKQAEEAGLAVLHVQQRDGGSALGQRGAVLRGRHGGTEHFGFKDGISQPSVRGYTSATFRHGRWESERHPGSPIIATGEFVLGYPGERGSYPGGRRPQPPGWMRDGSFQVFLRLTQDVQGWREQMDRLGSALSDDVAAKAIGRRRDGTPLAPGGGGQGRNDFDYADDPDGHHTPRFAHIRKVNPRDDARFDDRTRRVLRRGIPFGPRFDPDREGAGNHDAERGLLLNAFMASIEDQVEFVQRNWVASPRSAPASAGGEGAEPAADGPDPLIGAGAGPCVLRRQGEEPVELDLRRFVRTTGAVYAFAPSLAALRRLAGDGSMREG